LNVAIFLNNFSIKKVDVLIACFGGSGFSNVNA
jgi:hypothetical protein